MSTAGYDEGSLRLEVIGIPGIPEVKPGDDLGKLLVEAAAANEVQIEDGDVVVVSQKVVSKSEGRIVELSRIEPSEFAKSLAARTGKSPEEVEVILRESNAVVRVRCNQGILVTETKHGFLMANSGVDKSNVMEGYATLLPEDPDSSARRIRERIRELTGKDVAVIVSDTCGRPCRLGLVNIALGISGIAPFRDYRGKPDHYGKMLKVTVMTHVDELASAAELVMGKARMVPVAIIKGYSYEGSDEKATDIIMPEEMDMFR